MKQIPIIRLTLFVLLFIPLISCGSSGGGASQPPSNSDSPCSAQGSWFDRYEYTLNSQTSLDVLELSGAEFVDRDDGNGEIFYLISDSDIDQRLWVVSSSGDVMTSLHDNGSIAYSPAIDGEGIVWRGGDMFALLDESGHDIYECDNISITTTSINLLTDCRVSTLQEAVGDPGYLGPEGIEYDSHGYYYILEQSTALDEGGVWRVTIGNNTNGHPDDETRLFFNSDIGGLLTETSNANDLSWNGCSLFILSRGDLGNAVVSEVDINGNLLGEFNYNATQQREGLAFDFTRRLMMMVGGGHPETNVWTYTTTSTANPCTLTYEQLSGDAAAAAIGNQESRNAYRGIYYTGPSKDVCSAEVKFSVDGDVSGINYVMQIWSVDPQNALAFETLQSTSNVVLGSSISEGDWTRFTFDSPVTVVSGKTVAVVSRQDIGTTNGSNFIQVYQEYDESDSISDQWNVHYYPNGVLAGRNAATNDEDQPEYYAIPWRFYGQNINISGEEPNIPENIDAVALNSSTINIEWVESGHVVVDHYNIYEYSSGSGVETLLGTSSGVSSGQVQSFNHTGLSSGSTHLYVVRAVTAAGIEGWHSLNSHNTGVPVDPDWEATTP